MAALDGADVELLWAMAGGRRYLPDFLTPTPRTCRPSLEDELSAILTTPVRRVAEQVRRVHPDRPALPALARFVADPVAGLSRLADQINRYFERALAPQWPTLRAAAEAEITSRLELAAERGPRSLLVDLHPDLSWGGSRLRVALGAPGTLDGAALTLVPTAFAWPHTHPATEATVDAWVVSYPLAS